LILLERVGAELAGAISRRLTGICRELLMNRSFLRWAALACTSVTLALTSAGALAQAVVTLSDSNCSSFTLSAPPGPQTLTCVVSSVPTCAVQGSATATIGMPLNLTAQCSPAALYWAWTDNGGTNGCNGATTQSCIDATANYTNGQQVTYYVTGTNGVGPGPPGSLIVTWSNTPPAAPSGCSITGAPTGNQAAGYMATLTMTCQTGGAATSWAWLGGGAQGLTTQTVGPFAVNTTTTFTATASNAGGTSAPASVTITIGNSGTISCNGFPGGTLVEVMNYDDPGGGASTTAYTYNTGGFAANGALVVQFTTPAVPNPPTSKKGQIVVTEFSGPTADRSGSLSTTPCDFTGGIGGNGVFRGAPSVDIYFTLDYVNPSYPIELQPSTTYYLNMYNTQGCSPGPYCDVKITLTRNPGT
jgi:hypothetical protein